MTSPVILMTCFDTTVYISIKMWFDYHWNRIFQDLETTLTNFFILFDKQAKNITENSFKGYS